jgi:hypothetical protein
MRKGVKQFHGPFKLLELERNERIGISNTYSNGYVSASL